MRTPTVVSPLAVARIGAERRRRASRIEVPETGVGPHVKLAFSEMKRQGVTASA
jgi:hypothetical protein